jgi:hypothetical protein
VRSERVPVQEQRYGGSIPLPRTSRSPRSVRSSRSVITNHL